MKKVVVANLKSSLTDDNAYFYASTISSNSYDNLIVCPASNYFNLFNSNNYFLGSQDMEDDIETLKRKKVKYIILGHFDKRSKNETDETINNKIKIAIENDFKVILCVGNYEYQDIGYVYNQIHNCIDNIQKKENIIIAYEPFFMINSDNTLDISVICKYIKDIKDYIKLKYNTNNLVLYGGNVNENNIKSIMNMCDGVMIGRLCYDVQKFTELLQKI